MSLDVTEVRVYVEEEPGHRREIVGPTDMGLSLMELLKADGYDIQATCGGMALCGTCHVEVLAGPELPEPSDDELAMLESLPVMTQGSRLSCQIRINARLDGLVVRLMPQGT
ncbi:2Fe-2S iron-sulfur cluster-binding protein [Hymenobacter sp. DG25A]|jgi:2Fe-2S ferredoxin|uniref:2Fe-2S iron-sulfur cluster-binding protein n=1 Tax=Hymenobacter sp. DG25A TaxID=1385663 RepID=UPI0006BC727D|nr:2Fe-2S iron-sulfur cluster-binding protein [Hymenobacter sp. DG25A]ALD20193.1 ferredoxin [Hymenobacter sp. DG25A]